MLTESVQRLVSVFVILATFGVIFGNPVLLVLSLIPVFTLVLGLVSAPIVSIKVERKPQKSDLFVNETAEIELKIELGGGTGPVIIVDEIPEEFELVEGSNFKVIPGGGRTSEELKYKVKCTKRGNHEIGPVRWESRHIINLKQVVSGVKEDKVELRVKPKLLDPRKMRGDTSATRIPMPSGSISKFGIPTMDFKELREYSQGDPFRMINWKATARSSTGRDESLVINEYEREGRKQVWIYMDQSKTMNLGLSTANVFEYARDAVHSLSYYYLNEGCMVGFVPFNSRSSMITPDTGKKQYLKILWKLMELDLREGATGRRGKYGLSKSVSKNRPYMSGFSPFSVVITRITKKNRKSIKEGIEEIARNIQSKRRENLPIMMINIIGYGLSAGSSEEKLAGDLLKMEDFLLSKDIRKHTIWLDWDPSSETFTNALLRGFTRA